MTCIVAIKKDYTVYMGGDSAASSGADISIRQSPKIFSNGRFLFGYAGSFRFGQILQYAFKPPRRNEKKTQMEYMCTDFILKLQKTLEANGLDGTGRTGKETCGQALIAYNGEIYELSDDFHLGVVETSYNSIGSGSSVAFGSLYTTENLDMTPESRIMMALEASSYHNNTVHAPFTIISKDYKEKINED